MIKFPGHHESFACIYSLDITRLMKNLVIDEVFFGGSLTTVTLSLTPVGTVASEAIPHWLFLLRAIFT